MINKVKNLIAVSLASVFACGSLASAAEVSGTPEVSSSPVATQQVAPIYLSVVNQESRVTKALSAVKLAFYGTTAVGVGACCYKAYGAIGNAGNGVGKILNSADKIVNTANNGVDRVFSDVSQIISTANDGLRGAMDRFNRLLDTLSPEDRQKVMNNVDRILQGCGNSIESFNTVLAGINVEGFNGIGPAVVELLNAFKDVLTNVHPETGRPSNLRAIFNLLVKK